MKSVTIGIIGAILLALIGVVADFFIKLAGSGSKYIELKWFVLGALIYALTSFGWFYVMKHIKLSTLGVFYAVSTIIFLVIVGVFYFKEELRFYEGLGIFLGIISLILLWRFG